MKPGWIRSWFLAAFMSNVSQSARGELVMGASLDPYELHSTRSTLDFVEGLADHMLDLFPFLSHVNVNRQWAGMADMTRTSRRSWARRR